MITNWPAAQKAGRSPLNIGRTTVRNRRRQAQHAANVQYRAELQRQKSTGKVGVQSQVDGISKGIRNTV